MREVGRTAFAHGRRDDMKITSACSIRRRMSVVKSMSPFPRLPSISSARRARTSPREKPISLGPIDIGTDDLITAVGQADAGDEVDMAGSGHRNFQADASTCRSVGAHIAGSARGACAIPVERLLTISSTFLASASASGVVPGHRRPEWPRARDVQVVAKESVYPTSNDRSFGQLRAFRRPRRTRAG